ncbi:galactokinase [Micropruina sp.]|uniref:galactokinase n=1 Tax=Micropruina sp. TaxID=2737536 RepID=UPI00260C6B5A|nr:galactokinase [Micropruina sp.]
MSEWQQAWPSEVGVRTVRELFRTAYDAEPDGVWASPGRVNLIGEHTDYNGGLCLPIALPHRTYVAVSARSDGRVRMTTDIGDEVWEGAISELAPGQVSGWVAYCGGPAWALREAGFEVPGFDLAVASCVPLGAGLSSSAAVECAVGLALAQLAGQRLDTDDDSRARLAALCVRAENEVAGAPTGGMDQAASLRTTAGHALLLDCRDGSVEQVRFDLASDGLELLVIDTRASHSLADGQYGARRAACESAARILGVATLREVTDLDAALAQLDDEEVRRRVRHVVTEIARVTEFVAVAEAGDWTAAGELMDASHESLRDDYEVSCLELDVVVTAARAAGALGARMTGGGFGGSAIALVRSEDAASIARAVREASGSRGLPVPDVHQATPSEPGGCLVEP